MNEISYKNVFITWILTHQINTYFCSCVLISVATYAVQWCTLNLFLFVKKYWIWATCPCLSWQWWLDSNQRCTCYKFLFYLHNLPVVRFTCTLSYLLIMTSSLIMNLIRSECEQCVYPTLLFKKTLMFVINN